MAPCAEVRSSSPTSGGGWMGRYLAAAPLAGDEGRDCQHGQLARSCDRCADAREIAELREALALHEVGSAYAHRLAIMLECALLDRPGTWGDGHALLDEYRRACRAAAPASDPPTFLGEPVVKEKP
jgi:hypothetical protein